MRFFLPLLLLSTLTVFAADNIEPDGGFENPSVTGRTLSTKGGNPVGAVQPSGWVSLRLQNTGTSGVVTTGLTDEIARNGKQSLFVQFDHVDAPFQSVTLASNFMPVASGTDYIVGIWGRPDSKNPIDTNGRTAYLKLQVDYFAKDANESVGESFYQVQPIPGGKDKLPFFKPDDWSHFAIKITTPPDAVFAQITWRWETGSDKGQVNGAIFFDDATLVGPSAANPAMTPAPVAEPTDTPEPATSGTDATMSPASAASPTPAGLPAPSPAAQ